MSLDFAMRPEWEELRDRARVVAQHGVAEYGTWHDSWINGYSKDFARVLAAEGWIGMTWPVEVGGGGRPGIERVIMAEEMISASRGPCLAIGATWRLSSPHQLVASGRLLAPTSARDVALARVEVR